jgi:hypothetical protein
MFVLVLWVSAGGGLAVSHTLVLTITVITVLSTVDYVRYGVTQLPSRRASA